MNFLAQHISPAGDHPSGPLQIMYGIDGRTDLTEEGQVGADPRRHLPADHEAGLVDATSGVRAARG
jgi:hypothetical protein